VIGVADEDLVSLRRSLAMAPSLPADQIKLLLDEVEQLRQGRRDLANDLDALAAEVDRLRRRLAQTVTRPGATTPRPAAVRRYRHQ
jgi:regulator of replication initiation timing